MNWIECISEAISYIEANITEELTTAQIARHVLLSPFYFQKGFAMLCGFSVKEYIRNRRLTLAGSELAAGDERIIDLAIKYGYSSPDSFTKAFIRFHGVTPSAVRKDGAMIKSFMPLKIKLTLEGGCMMNYKIVEKSAFTIMGVAKTFKYEGAKDVVPTFWADYLSGNNCVCGTYGINIDETMKGDEFEYLIADNYDPIKDIPENYVTRTIPAFTWAVFPCVGAMVKTLQGVNEMIFSEWLPDCKDYQIAAGYCVEMYSDPVDYPLGVNDDNYYCEIWIPVKKK